MSISAEFGNEEYQTRVLEFFARYLRNTSGAGER